MISFTFKNTLSKGLKRYFNMVGIGEKGFNTIHFRAMEKIGIQLINWIINGSAKESIVPPIKEGILRGSGSVFVGSKLVHTTKGEYAQGTPNLSYNDKDNVITVGFNTAYAARMHETNWTPGFYSRQSGDVGNKFIEQHLKADGKDLLKLYAIFVKKESRA